MLPDTLQESHGAHFKCTLSQIRYWHKSRAANACPCQSEEMKRAARSIVGRCITRDASPSTFIRIQVRLAYRHRLGTREGDEVVMMLLARNELTAKSAEGLLHLLRHLSPESGSTLLSLNDSTMTVWLQNVRLNWLELVQSDGFVLSSDYKIPRLRCHTMNVQSPAGTVFGEDLLLGVARLFSRCYSIGDVVVPGSKDFLTDMLETIGRCTTACRLNVTELDLIHSAHISSTFY